MREAPNLLAKPANQLVVAGNACGPTALLNAFRFGSPAWQRASDAIAGETDKQRIYTVIRESGMRPSSSIKGRPRWSRKGVNLVDLCDIGNELTRGRFLPLMTHEVLFSKPGETQKKLLARVHQRLETSLDKGLPPIISLRRYVRRGENGKPPQWIMLDAHFVTIISVPGKLDSGVTSFPISYIDPWGGRICQGSISIPTRGVLAAETADSPCLEAAFPEAAVGKKLLHPGEDSTLTVVAALGRW
ncbi:MAG: hypothetical protein RLZZ214_346 [Verrucomicrobiota bacterium]